MPQPENTGNNPATFPVAKLRLQLACVLVILAMRLFPWLVANLWFDEVVTLENFILPRRGPAGFLSVFTSYPIANNHILFTAAGWLWTNLQALVSPDKLNILALRLLPAAFYAVAVAWVLCRWRRWLGGRAAFWAAMVCAISPVGCAFAWQFRGYSLSFLLAVIAADQAVRLRLGICHPRDFWLAGLVACLLPLTIPANILLVAALALFVALGRNGVAAPGQRLRRPWPLLLGGLLGAAYYLLIWEKFLRVARTTDGWDNAWAVAGNILLGLAAHLGIVGLWSALAGWRRGSGVTTAAGAEDSRMAAHLWLALALPVALVLAMPGETAPFPRVFLVFFPAFTLAAFLPARQAAGWLKLPAGMLLTLVLANGVVWETVSDRMTLHRLTTGDGRGMPQNLLQQYYRGILGISQSVNWLREHPEMADFIVVNEYYAPTFKFHWRGAGGDLATILAEGAARDLFNSRPAALPGSITDTLTIVAPGLPAAAGIANRLGFSGHGEAMIEFHGCVVCRFAR